MKRERFSPIKGESLVCAIGDEHHAGDLVLAARRLAAVSGLRPLFVHVRASPGKNGEIAARGRGRSAERAFGRLGIGRQELRCEAGDAADTIVRIVREERAALALAGASRRGLIARALLGGVCGALADDRSCPVVVVPNGADVTFSGGPIVCATSAGDDDDAVISWAAGFATATDRWLALGHLVPMAPLASLSAADGAGPVAGALLQAERETAAQRLNDARSRLPGALRSDVAVRCGDVATGIVELADDVQADAVVVGSRGRRPVHDIVFGSVAQRLFDTAPCPVIVLRLPWATRRWRDRSAF